MIMVTGMMGTILIIKKSLDLKNLRKMKANLLPFCFPVVEEVLRYVTLLKVLIPQHKNTLLHVKVLHFKSVK